MKFSVLRSFLVYNIKYPNVMFPSLYSSLANKQAITTSLSSFSIPLIEHTLFPLVCSLKKCECYCSKMRLPIASASAIRFLRIQSTHYHKIICLMRFVRCMWCGQVTFDLWRNKTRHYNHVIAIRNDGRSVRNFFCTRWSTNKYNIGIL